MILRRRMPLFGAVLVALVLVVGCGGGDDGPTRIRGELTFDDRITGDESFFDNYSFRARETGVAEISMSSDDVDSYLIVFRENANGSLTRITEDDDSGSGLDALVVFDVFRNERFIVTARSSGVRETGDYRLDFSEELGDIEFTTRAASRQAGEDPVATKKNADKASQ